jgi:hypothetical protein
MSIEAAKTLMAPQTSVAPRVTRAFAMRRTDVSYQMCLDDIESQPKLLRWPCNHSPRCSQFSQTSGLCDGFAVSCGYSSQPEGRCDGFAMISLAYHIPSTCLPNALHPRVHVASRNPCAGLASAAAVSVATTKPLRWPCTTQLVHSTGTPPCRNR